MRLKPNSVAEFTRTLDQEIIPLLRKQKGFQDEITLLARGDWKRTAVIGDRRIAHDCTTACGM